mgnify:CR=1 FL=1
MQEKLRKQLHFKSLVSSKVYYGLDCDKQMQENVKVQLRLLEHEYNRKRNYRSDMANKNAKLQEVIDEYRLQKMKMRESGTVLEAKFAALQDKMRSKMADANTLKLANNKLEDAVDQLVARAETQINEQTQEILDMRKKVEEHRRQAEEVENAALAKTLEQMEKMQAGMLSMEEEQEMRQRMRQLRHGIVDEAKRVEDSARRIMNHEMAFERLRKETELSDLGEIVELFVNREDDNFAIYSRLQRVERTLQKEEQKLRDVQEQTEAYLEEAKTQQGTTSSKFKSVEKQRDVLRAKLKAQEQVKGGLQAQQSKWSEVVAGFLSVLLASGIKYESDLLQQPAAAAVVNKVKEALGRRGFQDAVGSGDPEASVPADVTSFVDSNLEVALSIVEQCTSEVLMLGVPILQRSAGRGAQPADSAGVGDGDHSSASRLNRFGMRSPPTGRIVDRQQRWNIDPPNFAALEEDDYHNRSAPTPFDSTLDREALIAEITKRSMERPARRGTIRPAHPNHSSHDRAD